MQLPTMSLKEIQFTPTVFNPAKFEFQKADMSILERSLAQREARMKEAAQSKGAMDIKLGEYETKLNPAEAEWFAEYKNEIRNQLQSSIDAGDSGEVIRNAQYLAGNVAQDPRLIGRMRSQTAWEEENKKNETRVANNKVSKNALAWYNTEYGKYNYTDIQDSNGNYIEGPTWQPIKPLYDDLNWAEQMLIADKFVRPKKGSTDRGGGSSITNANGTGTGDKWSSGKSYEGKSASSIRQSLNDILQQIPDGIDRAMQQFEVDKYSLQKLQKEYDAMSDDDPAKISKKQQLDTMKSYLYDGNQFVDWKTYYLRRVTNNPIADRLAYWYENTSNNKFISTDNQLTGGIRTRTPGDGSYLSTDNSLSWSSVEVEQAQEESSKNVETASNGIVKRFTDL